MASTDLSELKLKLTTDGVTQATDELESLGNTAKNAEAKVEGLSKRARSNVAPMKNMRAQAQQVSYQLQDMAVQTQMGTDKLIILGQQGPQLASVFGPGGAVIGAFIAFGSIIAGTLLKMGGAKTATEQLEQALGRLGNKAIDIKNNIYELNGRILELAERSTVAAKAELISLAVEAESAFKATGRTIAETNEAIAGVRISTVSKQLDQLKKKGLTATDLVNLGDYESSIAGLSYLQDAVLEVADEFNLTNDQALAFLEGASKIGKGSTIEDYNNFANVIDELAISVNGGNEEFRAFREGIVDQVDSLRDFTGQAELSKIALEAFTQSGIEGLKQYTEGATAEAKKVSDAKEKSVAAQIKEEERLEEQLRMFFLKSSEEQAKGVAKLESDLDAFFAARGARIATEDQKRIDSAIQFANQMARVGESEIESFINTQAEQRAILDQSLADKLISHELHAEAVKGLNDELNAYTLEKNKTYLDEWFAQVEETTFNVDMMQTEMASSLQAGFAGAIEGFLSGTQTAKEAVKGLVMSIGQSMVSMIANNLAQLAAAYIVQKIMGKTAEASAASAMVANALATQQLAALAAFASTAAIPVVGPGLAPKAAAAALAATTPMVTAITAFTTTATAARALGGQVRGGESYLVGERGPELLTMGTSGRIATNENLKKAVGSQGETVQQNVSVNFSIQANDTAGFDRLLNSRRGQIISMINQAVNDRGRASLA